MLTFVILLMFAAVVGKLAQERLEDDFRNDLQEIANRVAFAVQFNPQTGLINEDPLEDITIGDAIVRITPTLGETLENNAAALPPPNPNRSPTASSRSSPRRSRRRCWARAHIRSGRA